MTSRRHATAASAPRESEYDRAAEPATVTILGVRVHACSMRQSARRMEELFASGTKHVIVPVNPEMIVAARSHREFQDTINAASLVLPDGTGVLLASRLQGTRIHERVPGADAVELLSAIAARSGAGVFLLGAAPGVAEAAGRCLKERHPKLLIAGTHAGSPELSEEEAICGRINASKAEILLVAYGAPRQELWVSRNLPRLNVRLVMSVGGTFDFLAGVKVRAPRWMQRAGLEWLFRLVQEPRRWRRMLALPKFALLALTERVIQRS